MGRQTDRQTDRQPWTVARKARTCVALDSLSEAQLRASHPTMMFSLYVHVYVLRALYPTMIFSLKCACVCVTTRLAHDTDVFPVCACVSFYACMCVYLCVCACAYRCVHVCMCLYLRMCLCVYVCTLHVCACPCA
jgi:hypothetical protein